MSEQLFDQGGRRKYLTARERRAFLKAAEDSPEQVRTLCHVLAFTGCRISEALALTADRVDFESGQIIFESLKKRRKGVYRGVPVPSSLLDMLDDVHDLRSLKQIQHSVHLAHIWTMSRPTAWRAIKTVMGSAGIEAGPQASPKGLRHGFGVFAVSAGVPLNMIQKWLGHAQISTTAIYANAQGPEERNLAERMWGSS
ncbi:MAG: tyrosine-type recombinase/integrase [Proteobacteria bacterium]|nr:tyrosine-type recombinase/integrase [Pseudomonadota bacterium]